MMKMMNKKDFGYGMMRLKRTAKESSRKPRSLVRSSPKITQRVNIYIVSL